MRDAPSDAIDLITQPKEVSLRATFTRQLPVFTHHITSNSIGLTDPAWIDACNWGSGILRVASVGNVLYTQYVPDIHADPWPAWVSTGFSLYPGSVPAVDAGYIHYQASNGDIRQKLYGTGGIGSLSRNMPGACALAPLQNRCWALWQRNPGSYEIVSLNCTESSQYTIYGPTSMPRIDVVSFNGKEYFYTMDRDEGRVIEIVHVGQSISGRDSYGVGKSVIPIDAIDDVYGFKLGYAARINNRIVVTGRLTRTSDDTPVAFDAYASGPEHFSFGREMFIQDDYLVTGKMLRVVSEFIVAGAQHYWLAPASDIFDPFLEDDEASPDLKITTSDLSSATLTEAEGRSSTINIDLSSVLSHEAIACGSDIVLEMAYNNHWTKLTTCVLETDTRSNATDGQVRMVSGIGKSAKKLKDWSPDQGVYIPSQARNWDWASTMTRVMRATGQWIKSSPEDEDSPLQLSDLNKLGVLYTTTRPSRGGTMRAEFYFPDDANGYFKPWYGVGINYYRETAAEAAARLGVEVDELTDDLYGHNGIVAAWSQTEHNNAPGVALYLWRDSVLTKLTSASLNIPSLTWHLLQISFVEGEIRVQYKTQSQTQWTEIIAYQYNQPTLPWKRETLGRGVILVKNIVPETNCYPLSHDDMCLGVDSNTAFPSSGTLRVDDERMTYTSKSTATPPADWGADISRPPGWASSPKIFWINNLAYKSVDKAGFAGQPKTSTKWLATSYLGESADYNPFSGVAAHGYSGLAMVTLASAALGTMRYFAHGNRTFKVTDFDPASLSVWVPNNMLYPSGWEAFIGVPGNGAYGSYSGATFHTSVDLHQLLGLSDNPLEGDSAGGQPGAFVLKPAFHLSSRGASNTTATSHGISLARYDPNKFVQVGRVGCFTQDEDQSMEDALKTIVSLAGGQARCKSVLSSSFTFNAPTYCAVGPATGSGKNFIATFDVPDITQTVQAGVCFRGQVPWTTNNGWPSSGGQGYYLAILYAGSKYYLALYDAADPGTWFERVPLRHTNLNGAATANAPRGTVKVSVQGNFFSVWLNGRYLHTFYDEHYPTGDYVGFSAGLSLTMTVHLSELDDLLSDIVVGTRGNGMSVLSELLADRHILWRDEPDGSMYFYKTRDTVDDMPDIVAGVEAVETDTIVSRMRAEGLNISEILDAQLIKEHGNIFATVNARYANDVHEAHKEAAYLIDESWRQSRTKKYAIVPHPGLQPGDAAVFMEAPGVTEQMTVRSQSLVVGFFGGNNFVCEMQCEVMPFEREPYEAE